MVAKAITIEWERDLSFPPRPAQVYFLKDLVTLGFNTFKGLKNSQFSIVGWQYPEAKAFTAADQVGVTSWIRKQSCTTIRLIL